MTNPKPTIAFLPSYMALISPSIEIRARANEARANRRTIGNEPTKPEHAMPTQQRNSDNQGRSYDTQTTSTKQQNTAATAAA